MERLVDWAFEADYIDEDPMMGKSSTFAQYARDTFDGRIMNAITDKMMSC